jgi:hypothetical protein
VHDDGARRGICGLRAADRSGTGRDDGGAGAAYCSTFAQTYAEYVGSVPSWLGGNFRGGEAAALDARVAIAQCQDGNYAGGIPTLRQKLRDARVPVPPPPVG